MLNDHVPVPAHLVMEPEYEGTVALLAEFDPDLRLRKSMEVRDMYVLERRCRRAPAVNSSMVERSDMHIQARDGYIHVSGVHGSWLHKPWNMIWALLEQGADIWAHGGAQKLADEDDYEEAWVRETRRRKYRATLEDIAGDGYDILSRMNIGGERSRMNNAGLPASPSASA